MRKRARKTAEGVLILDDKDLRILDVLQKQGRITLRELARKVGSPVTTVHSRVKRLEKAGIIRAYRAVLSPEKLGLKTLAFVLVSFSGESGVSQREVARKIADLPEVQEVHIITGTWDILVKVRVSDVEDLGRFVIDKIRAIPGVEKTLTCVVLDTLKETMSINVRSVGQGETTIIRQEEG